MITTHILDTSLGKPAAGVTIILATKDGDSLREIGHGVTDADGRLKTLTSPETVLPPGIYQLTFHTGAYFTARGERSFYPFVTITFETLEGESHYHVPLLLNPFGYSTYRGS